MDSARFETALSIGQTNITSEFVSRLEQKYNCLVRAVIFFGSTAQKLTDSYSDVDVMVVYDGDLPTKNERKEMYLPRGRIERSIDGVSNLAPGTHFSEDVVLVRGNSFHIDFRQMKEIRKIFKRLECGDFSSFYFLHCLQNWVKTRGGLPEYEELLEAIPDKAKSNFLDSIKLKIAQTLHSMTKAVIRGDEIRYLELLLQNIYQVIDFYYVSNDRYPWKKKGLRKKLEKLKNGNDLYDRFLETLNIAVTNQEESYNFFIKTASTITGMNFSYDNIE